MTAQDIASHIVDNMQVGKGGKALFSRAPVQSYAFRREKAFALVNANGKSNLVVVPK